MEIGDRFYVLKAGGFPGPPARPGDILDLDLSGFDPERAAYAGRYLVEAVVDRGPGESPGYTLRYLGPLTTTPNAPG